MSKRSLALKKRLKAGETTYGAWLSVSNPVIAEIIAGTGFDWVLIDTEHGAFSIEGLQMALMAFNGSPTVPIVRVAWNDAVRIKQALDVGADGILIPMVNNAEEAKRAVAACKYPPEGIRGFGPRRASDYARDMDSYVAQANDSVIVITQIENVHTANNIEEILDVPGIDVICLGPTDLSGTAGVLRQFNHPTVVKAVENVVVKAHARGFPVATGVIFPDEETKRWVAKGANFVITAEDTALVRSGMTDALAHFRGLLKAKGAA